ncbi:MAG: hypothetical protein GF381_04090, partial [Candidatus Pacebacteria bacterium]|nr:hypothetical protein [Candidatus Paceibacterota bacterium]
KSAKSEKKSKKKTTNKSKKAKEKEEQPGLSEQQKKDIQIQAIFKQLTKELKPVIPELLIKQNTRREIENFQRRLKQLNIEVDDYLASQGINFDQLASRMAFSSLSQLQVEFLIDAIATKEKIEASDKDIKNKLEQIEDKKTRDKMTKDEGYQNYLKSIIIKQKVIEHLLSI